MRDMVTCFSEHAIRISETTCSSSSSTNYHQFPTTPPPQRHHHHQQQQIPANQTAISSLYKITLTTGKILFITLIWTRNQTNHQHGLTITLSSTTTTNPPTSYKILTTTTPTATSRLFRRKKGTKSLDFISHKIDILWDFTDANYNTTTVKPVNGFYVIVMVDSELTLTVGDLSSDVVVSKKITIMNNDLLSVGKFTLVSRKEHYHSSSSGGESSNTTVYSTKARFIDDGDLHEIVIRCDGGDVKGSSSSSGCLNVSVDKNTVMRVKKLRWNFRGNQTVFVDGLLVDLFWDVHDWFFGDGGELTTATAVFMFRKRCGVENRLWLQDENKHDHDDLVIDQKKKSRDDKDEFSLLIYATKR